MTHFGLSDGSRDLIQSVFVEMMESCSGILALMVSTVDGHALTSHHGELLDESRMAAMTSSLLAIAESLAREAKQNVCQHIIVQNSDGVIVTQRLGKSLVLTAVAGKSTNLGMLHSVTRVGVEKIIKRHK
jgi:predicted regulator of Ras-like GTPase activity (Roadblock/LC7/MglB family)